MRAAARGLEDVAVRTPLLPSHGLSESVAGEVRLKCENLQRTGSFKIRGAFTFLSRLSSDELRRGVITYSSGNHGQAVSLAARLLGGKAVVVMPTTAPSVKREGVERLGGMVVLEGTTSEERRGRAESMARAEGWTVVPPFHHSDILAGQGTVGLEIWEDWAEVETVLVPVGGGGLLGGMAAALRRLAPGIRVVGVEPGGARSLAAALEAGRPVTLERVETVADGLAPVRVSDLTYRHAAELVDEVIAVDDSWIRRATAWLVRTQKLIAEPSGAATVAALLAGALPARETRVAAVVSGGNIDDAALRELLEPRGEASGQDTG